MKMVYKKVVEGKESLESKECAVGPVEGGVGQGGSCQVYGVVVESGPLLRSRRQRCPLFV